MDAVYRTLAMRPGDEPPRALACPWCGRRAMGMRAKVDLHHETAMACQRCGERVSVSWVNVLPAVPFVVAAIATPVALGEWLDLSAHDGFAGLAVIGMMPWVLLWRRTWRRAAERSMLVRR